MSTQPTHALTRPWEMRSMDRLARRAVLGRLAGLRHGRLQLIDPDGIHVLGGAGGAFDVCAHVHDPAAWAALAFRGSVGAGEAFVRGQWSADDLVAVMRLLTRNRDRLEALEGGLARLATAVLGVVARMGRNDRQESRANIAAHYDLGNDFFELFLDETMTYSCGIFEDDTSTLADASLAKLDRLCRKLRLGPGDRVLEIGTGWGSFALHAAERYGCHVTTTTISRRQLEAARARVAARGLEDRVTLLDEDYRDLDGTYSKVVSIEMIEAIGHDQLPTFFRRVGELLEADGSLALQAITIADQNYDRARRSVDFIKKHIFPGSCIPSTTALMRAATAASDLRLVHVEGIGPHYARTLAAWRSNLLRNRAEVRRRGYPDELVRKWEYYLALCEGGFAERYLGDVQMVFERPEARCEPLLGALESTT